MSKEVKELKKALHIVWMLQSSSDLVEKEDRQWLLEYFNERDEKRNQS